MTSVHLLEPHLDHEGDGGRRTACDALCANDGAVQAACPSTARTNGAPTTGVHPELGASTTNHPTGKCIQTPLLTTALTAAAIKMGTTATIVMEDTVENDAPRAIS